MPQDIQNFAAQFLRVVLMALVPVVGTAFISIPWNLGKIPGDPATQVAAGERHLT